MASLDSEDDKKSIRFIFLQNKEKINKYESKIIKYNKKKQDLINLQTILIKFNFGSEQLQDAYTEHMNTFELEPLQSPKLEKFNDEEKKIIKTKKSVSEMPISNDLKFPQIRQELLKFKQNNPGVKQKDMASAIGVSSPILSEAFKNNKRSPKFIKQYKKNRHKLTDLRSSSLKDLYSSEDEMEKTKKTKKKSKNYSKIESKKESDEESE